MKGIAGLVDGIFGNINWMLSNITDVVTKTPADILGKDYWNGLLKIGTIAVLPFAIIILSYCMAAELYRVYCRSNGALDLELVCTTFVKFILPYFIVIKSYDLIQWIYRMFNSLITTIYSSLTIGGINAIDTSALDKQLQGLSFFDKIGSLLEIWPLWVAVKLLSVIIIVIIYGRLFEIIILWIFSPIPLATLASDDIGQIGKNFIKLFCAAMLQGAVMLLCAALYVCLVKKAVIEPSIGGAFTMLGYSAVLAATLAVSGSLSKRILGTF